jgi:hypothetical protein
MKHEIRQIFGVILQLFVCGSELRARWHYGVKDSCRAGKFQHQTVSKCQFCQNCRLIAYNSLQANTLKVFELLNIRYPYKFFAQSLFQPILPEPEQIGGNSDE